MRILLGSISVLPTHVGVILKSSFSPVSPLGTTHTRGGDPAKIGSDNITLKYYPHTWG